MRSLSLGALLALAACSSGAPAPAPSGSAATTASARASASARAPVETYGVPVGIPGEAAKVVDAVNPRHEKPYAGPKATLKGRVRIEGDPPPETHIKFDPKCTEGTATYGKLFRVGLDKALADAMVSVTRYQDRGFIPAAGPAVQAAFRGCAALQRTYVLAFGQRLEVTNLDRTTEPYIPMLDGAPSKAMSVIVPGGPPVKLYAMEPGRYMLRDAMGRGPVADVFVLKYATHAVTGLDGQYEIRGLPTGKVRIDAFLPIINKADGREIDLVEGDNTADFTLRFDAKADLPSPAPSGSASAGAAPAASARVPSPPGPKAPEPPR